MIEVVGNLWTYPADVRAITTNGFVKKDGTCVMGRGCAKEAALKFPTLPLELGTRLKVHGNHVFLLGAWTIEKPYALYSFPVKHNWHEKADLDLITRSAQELLEAVDNDHPNDAGQVILVPRPGCGNGQLKWDDVKPVLDPIFDDRFYIIDFA